MPKKTNIFFKTELLQFLLFLFVNGLFIIKYVSRTDINPILILLVYILVVLGAFFVIRKTIRFFPEKIYKFLFWGALFVFTIVIFLILRKIDPYSVRVDRWSAVTFFLDYLFQGQYPYGASTHLGTTNFPSPFPVWYLINLPFYLFGDVGYNLIFFLCFITLALRYFFGSYREPFFFLVFLALSPAYWWEVFVRSDSLSNAFLILGFVLWFSKKNYSLSKNFWLSILCCGLLSSTRLSALLPIALFFFKAYTQLPLKKIILFPIFILLILFVTFSPFIFWDTQNWIFFTRNPFISQGGAGNIYVLLFMSILGIGLSFSWKNMTQYFSVVSIFVFFFFIISQIVMVSVAKNRESTFGFELYDISYFTLYLPYYFCFFLSRLSDKLIFPNKKL